MNNRPTQAGRYLMLRTIFCVLALQTLASWHVPSFSFSRIANSQEAFPWARIAQLTERKGFKDVTLRDTCEKLGLTPDQNCLVYQAPYDDEKKNTHAFNVYRQPRTGAVYFILF